MTTEQIQAALLDEFALHQIRVLLLIDSVSNAPGSTGKLDGLTKLAKLDFLVRYPEVVHSVEAAIDGNVRPEPHGQISSSLPMLRYKYGPWDDRYYPVIGGLVGRGLATYRRGQRGSVALSLTPEGKALASTVRSDPNWLAVARRYSEIAERFAKYNGNQLKNAIYRALPDQLDVPHRSKL